MPDAVPSAVQEKEYLRDHKLHVVTRDMVDALTTERPDEPRKWMVSWLRRNRTKYMTEEQIREDQALQQAATPESTPYFSFSAEQSFSLCTEQEKKYVHHMLYASWYGMYIVAEQTSPESVKLLETFRLLFDEHSPAEMKELAVKHGNVSPDSYDRFLEYVALFYANLGNYLSFGDTKFVPSCSKADFEAIIRSCPSHRQELEALLKAVANKVYSLQPHERQLGIEKNGISAYYKGATKEDIDLVTEWLKEKKMEPVNTRLFKQGDRLIVKVASAEKRPDEVDTFKGTTIVVSYGDYSKALTKVAEHLEKAREYAANDTQRKMLEHYVKHFRGGDLEEHKASQREWVQDKGPVVETNIGFVETLRDPVGMRAEFEGMVALVNKEQSQRYQALVENAPALIEKLPWTKEFEKDTFLKPDFTSLEVITFCCSGVPAGINIPNYDDIRQKEGFKNVYLANVISAFNKDEKMSFITDADWEIFKEHYVATWDLHVGLHELLGHGCGKLLQEEKGVKNFDPATVNPLTGKAVETWYKEGETYNSVFGDFSSAYEECRAECSGLYLCLEDEALEVFGHKDKAAKDAIVFCNWLQMTRAGLQALLFYTPESKTWRQAHMQARYVILRTLLEKGDGVVEVKVDTENSTAEIRVDPDKIRTSGKKAIGDLLRELNIHKAVADEPRARQFFVGLSEVDDTKLAWRTVVLENKKPRGQYVQGTTFLKEGGSVEYKEYEGSVVGMIESFRERFRVISL